MKNNVVLIFLLAFVFRIFLTPLAFHADLIVFAEWGLRIFETGTKGFYGSSVWIYAWPTQLPLFNLILEFCYFLFQHKLTWFFSYVEAVIQTRNIFPEMFGFWFKFVNWFGHDFYRDTPYLWGHLITIKLPVILADLGIGLIVYLVAKAKDQRRKIFWTSLYLFFPFSWYLSSLWGQYDQVTVVFLMLSFLSLYKKNLSFLSIPLFALSVAIKPTSLIFAPLLLYFLFVKRTHFLHIGLGLIIAALIMIIPTLQFTDKPVFEFVNGDLKRLVLGKSEIRVSTNSFNFWHILIGNRAMGHDAPFLFIPAKVWGYISFFLLYVLALKRVGSGKKEDLFFAMFVIGFGGWMFLTNMLERYVLAGIVGGLLYVIYKPQYLKYWIILSLVFWINLYHGFWFPPQLDYLRSVLIFQDGLMTRLLSLVNLIVFILILKQRKSAS